jgi:hypothetical protein
LKCPHCLVEIHTEPREILVGTDCDGDWGITTDECPACNRLILTLSCGRSSYRAACDGKQYWHAIYDPIISYFIRPIAPTRSPCPPEVSFGARSDYEEACAVLPFSRKASAALSRRCLQGLLREHVGITGKRNLDEEIKAFIRMPAVPSNLCESIDAIRQVGNFAVHPLKSTNTGEVLDVEPGEAEWILDVLEELFDFLYTKPARLRKRREALNSKLRDAGKAPMT